MAEKEYIERETVINEIVEWCEMYPDSDAAREALSLVKRAVRNIPAAAVRPVVLCRDCKFRSNEWTGCPKLNGTITGDEFFCAAGEKREES